MGKVNYSEEELKKIILGVGSAPDFGEEYDHLTVKPFVRKTELISEGTVSSTLSRAQERVAELSTSPGMGNVSIGNSFGNGNAVLLYYTMEVSKQEYVNDKLRAWRQTSPQNNYKEYLYTSLGLKNQSSIRNIFVKLLLEHKITTQDFVDLVEKRDVEVNLVELCGGTQGGDSNYFI